MKWLSFAAAAVLATSAHAQLGDLEAGQVVYSWCPSGPTVLHGACASCVAKALNTLLVENQIDAPQRDRLQSWFAEGGCACRPRSCAAAGANCGSIHDGCAGPIDCGTCSGFDTCGGAGQANVCGCTPAVCAASSCGNIPDGCGGSLTCDACPSVTVTLSPASVAAGQSAQALATLTDTGGAPLSGRSIAWSSSNPAVATVNDTGRVVTLAPGQALITAASEGTSGSASLNVGPPPPVDGCTTLISNMLSVLPTVINNYISTAEAMLPGNPHLAAQLQAKITMLQDPELANEISSGQYYTCSNARSMGGPWVSIGAIYPAADMREDAIDAVGTVELALPVLEDFMAIPVPMNTETIVYGFILGAWGGCGSMTIEDRAGYEARTPPTGLLHEAIIDHEVSHCYIGHEALNQFLELYVYNLVNTGSTHVADWIHRREYAPFDGSNTDLSALLDIYQLIGLDAMKRAYRVVYSLHPRYGEPLQDSVRQAFVDESPQDLKGQVSALIARVW